MKNKLNHFLAILFLFFTTQSYSNPIDKISFIGLNATIKSSIIDNLSFKVGQNYSAKNSNKIIQELFNTGYFSDIEITKNTNELIITVKENPYIKYFKINLHEPNPWTNWIAPQEQLLSLEKLQDYLKERNLTAGSIFSKVEFDKFILNIKNEYISNGFYNVEINDEIQIDDENRAEIDLSIKQGKIVKVSSMKILGSNEFTEKELL